MLGFIGRNLKIRIMEKLKETSRYSLFVSFEDGSDKSYWFDELPTEKGIKPLLTWGTTHAFVKNLETRKHAWIVRPTVEHNLNPSVWTKNL